MEYGYAQKRTKTSSLPITPVPALRCSSESCRDTLNLAVYKTSTYNAKNWDLHSKWVDVNIQSIPVTGCFRTEMPFIFRLPCNARKHGLMILITGASGQIGVDLADVLVERHGDDQVLVTDLRIPELQRSGRSYDVLDVTYMESVEKIIQAHDVHTIFHLAGILSATGERHPELAWNVNVNGVRNILEAARRFDCKVFWPSSIAVFGPTTPKDDTPQETVTEPGTMYGATKVTGELLCKFHATHHGVDVRSVRFPGIVSHSAPPGGGTTDWAVDMFFEAVRNGRYECFVTEDTRLPMMYMPDAVKSVLDLMDAPNTSLTVRTSYNIAAFSFSAGELASALKKYVPAFECTYAPDYRQEIANSWPLSINDERARRDWQWMPEYDLDAMVQDMLHHVREKVARESADSADNQ